MKVTCNRNGNFLTGGSFEQPDTLRSVADPTDFWAEEPITRGSEIKRQDFFDIVGSLRNSFGLQTQFHFTFNPISKLTWIYKDFFEAQLYDVETVFANYWDNPFCPQSTIDFLESLKTLDPKRYEVDALGNWGVSYEGLIYPEYESVTEMPEVKFYG
jgi:phage terminase large subunit